MAGIAAVTAIGVAAYFLTKEDEADLIRPRVTKKIGAIETVMLRESNVIELNQLMKIMDMVREIFDEKIVDSLQ